MFDQWRALVEKELAGKPVDPTWLYHERKPLPALPLSQPQILAREQWAGDAVSTLDHDGDAVSETALALKLGYEALQAGRNPLLRVTVGRDTFTELCKLRALRLCWAKLRKTDGGVIHAVCAERNKTAIDPWVNMLRVTTELFAAILGGADYITPSPGRIEHNAALVLLEEALLAQVSDAAAGSYFFDALTDSIAREAWALVQKGGIEERAAEARKQREKAIRTRKLPILGVSEFANLDEKVAGVSNGDAAPYEKLRALPQKKALLLTLGAFAESRARAGFAQNLLAAGGIRSSEATAAERADIACVCGTDERYATDAVTAAKALKAAGCKKVLLAGRPGALEAELRAAGVDDFIYMGCDVVAVLERLHDVA